MRKIVYAVYHDCNKEARSMELLHCCRRMGHVDFVSYAVPQNVNDINMHFVDKQSPFALFKFLYLAKDTIRKVNPDWVVLHDNDCAALLPFIKKNYPNTKIIYDSSELFIQMEGSKKAPFFGNDGIVVWLKKQLTVFREKYERRYLKYADVVIAANLERAKIMEKYFGLDSLPLIFDNIHKIGDIPDNKECQKKFEVALKKDRFNILFGGGISEERKTFDYIRSFKQLSEKFNLVIVGSASPLARKRYIELTQGLDGDRIHYLGFISRAELRYCMMNCQASVVVFDKDSYNTLYCASGKCFESLFEGVPILASENPPLKRLCDENKIGVSNDDYAAGAIQLESNYEFYSKSVRKYIDSIHYQERLDNLIKVIEETVGVEHVQKNY
ncbi:MAG: glycosyl transferase group 1 [Herbinix sp.]|jgi:glycosyltransferase involved in cell wall biosynthesis|nr:glycosyl transferase group 1 [Herbinix sp.]